MPDAGGHVRAASRAEVTAAFAAVYVLWGSTFLAIRFGVETIPPFVLAGCRHLTAGLILYAVMRGRGAPRPSAKHWRSATIVGGLLLLGGNGLVTWAEQRVPSGLAALMVASVPIWMTVLDGLQRRERPHGVVVLGLALGLGGIAFLVAPGRFAGGSARRSARRRSAPDGGALLGDRIPLFAPRSPALVDAPRDRDGDDRGRRSPVRRRGGDEGVARLLARRRFRRGRSSRSAISSSPAPSWGSRRTSSCSARRPPRASRPTPT